jgi:hypothetical protein
METLQTTSVNAMQGRGQTKCDVGAAIGATGEFLERAQELPRGKVNVLAVGTPRTLNQRAC